MLSKTDILVSAMLQPLKLSILTRIGFIFLAAFITACAQAAAQPSEGVAANADTEPTITVTPPRPTRTAASTHIATVLATDAPIANLPTATEELGEIEQIYFSMPGISVDFYAEVSLPTSLAFGPDGRLYVASLSGEISALTDDDGDGLVDEISHFAERLRVPLGLLWVDETLFISIQGYVVTAEDSDGDGAADSFSAVIADLPASGAHQNDGMAFGPDGYIYLGMGSTCNVCVEADPRSATILRFLPDGSDLSIVATGLRNPYDVAFNLAGDLFATDNGRDDLGATEPPEELNHIQSSNDYGWPDCWEGIADPACDTRTGAVAEFDAHASANGLTFYSGDVFPAEFRDNAFVAIFGSYEFPDVTRGVQRVSLEQADESYIATEVDWLFKSNGRPLDLTVGPDGALYMADFELNAIYRIEYVGE